MYIHNYISYINFKRQTFFKNKLKNVIIIISNISVGTYSKNNIVLKKK